LCCALQLPEYFSWSYLLRNELATAHRPRMFYTDETGETVPASDDEDADQVRTGFSACWLNSAACWLNSAACWLNSAFCWHSRCRTSKQSIEADGNACSAEL
jgi:hypothetical protein